MAPHLEKVRISWENIYPCCQVDRSPDVLREAEADGGALQ